MINKIVRSVAEALSGIKDGAVVLVRQLFQGKINAQQHLAENMAFIKQSTEKRIERLKERMAKD